MGYRMTPLDLGRILYEGRVRAAWGKQADHRLSQEPYPRHEAEEMPEPCWLAIQQAKAVLNACNVERPAPPEQGAGIVPDELSPMPARERAEGEAEPKTQVTESQAEG